MTRFALRNPHVVAVAALAVVVLGVVSYGRIPADLLPIFRTPAVQIVTFYPGMPPEVMERDIMSRLERWTGQSVGISHQEGKSMLGVSIVKDFFRSQLCWRTTARPFSSRCSTRVKRPSGAPGRRGDSATRDFRARRRRWPRRWEIRASASRWRPPQRSCASVLRASRVFSRGRPRPDPAGPSPWRHWASSGPSAAGLGWRASTSQERSAGWRGVRCSGCVRAAQATGFTLDDIKQLLRPARCDRVQGLIEARLSDVGARMREFRHVQKVLRRALALCREHEETGRCAVVETLSAPARRS